MIYANLELIYSTNERVDSNAAVQQVLYNDIHRVHK
jgi:hypothetical protein